MKKNKMLIVLIAVISCLVIALTYFILNGKLDKNEEKTPSVETIKIGEK